MALDASTFLFADLAGFTALTEAHGDEQAADLAADFCGRIRELLGADGEVVKTIGDAAMCRCLDPAVAITLGLTITEELGGAHGALAVRVGMHTGPAVERQGDWFGATVNVAARVTGLAAGGQVLLTDATAAAAGVLPGVELRAHGLHDLRHVAEPVVVLQAVSDTTPRDPVELDPVCRMIVDAGQAAGTLDHRGRHYRFCSLRCAACFAADPDRYAFDTVD